MTTEPALPAERLELLENGEAFFPRVLDAIAAAREEVLLETFILAEDSVGQALHRALISAADRGAKVSVTVDDYGSHLLSEGYVAGLRAAGVRFHRYAPAPTTFGVRTNVFRRLHRKLVTVDSRLAYIGGINFCADHLRSFGPSSKQDYAAEIEGPVVLDIRALMQATLARLGEALARRPMQRLRHRLQALRQLPGTQLVYRDNELHRDDIERHYRKAIREARREVLIANAYFFPSYLLLRELAQAARRGVQVRLMLQGRPDLAVAQFAARNLYDYLLRAGVIIHEFIERPFHGKVAVVDGEWATLGSSNLDPLSLALNLEANIVSREAGFVADLRTHLDRLIREHCKRIDTQQFEHKRGIGRQLIGGIAFHVLRHFPEWAGMDPGHTPTVVPAAAVAGRDALQ